MIIALLHKLEGIPAYEFRQLTYTPDDLQHNNQAPQLQIIPLRTANNRELLDLSLDLNLSQCLVVLNHLLHTNLDLVLPVNNLDQLEHNKPNLDLDLPNHVQLPKHDLALIQVSLLMIQSLIPTNVYQPLLLL